MVITNIHQRKIGVTWDLKEAKVKKLIKAIEIVCTIDRPFS